MKIKPFIFLSLILSITSCVNEERFDEKDFSISNSEIINKIIMSDKSGTKIILLKNENGWKINNHYKVWERKIDYTLGVMEDIRIKSPVSEKKMMYVIENISTTGVKVEIFEQNKRIRSYYIGGNTPDHLGTYMIVEKSTNAYIVHIPNRQPGILNPKYGIEGIYLNEDLWREPIKISIPSEEIQKVKVEDFINENQSFTMNMEDESLTDFENNEVKMDVRGYPLFASFFKKLECGSYKPNLKTSDLVLSKKIFITHNKTIDSLIIYDETAIQKAQKKSNTEVEHLFATLNNSELVIIQKDIFNNVLITLDEIKE